jgi:hypothetical protein
MKKQLTRIAPLKAGIVLGSLYGLLGLIIFLPLSIVFSLLGVAAIKGTAMPVAFGLGFAILAPVFYGIMGFIFGVISAAIYNLVAGWTGGLEFEVRDLGPTA